MNEMCYKKLTLFFFFLNLTKFLKLATFTSSFEGWMIMQTHTHTSNNCQKYNWTDITIVTTHSAILLSM